MENIRNTMKKAPIESGFEQLIGDFVKLNTKDTIKVYVGIDDLQTAVKQQMKEPVAQAIKDSMGEAIQEACDNMGQAIRQEVNSELGKSAAAVKDSGGPKNKVSSANRSTSTPGGMNGDASARSGPSSSSSVVINSGVKLPGPTPGSERAFVGGFNSGSSAPLLGGQTKPTRHVPDDVNEPAQATLPVSSGAADHTVAQTITNKVSPVSPFVFKSNSPGKQAEGPAGRETQRANTAGSRPSARGKDTNDEVSSLLEYNPPVVEKADASSPGVGSSRQSTSAARKKPNFEELPFYTNNKTSSGFNWADEVEESLEELASRNKYSRQTQTPDDEIYNFPSASVPITKHGKGKAVKSSQESTRSSPQPRRTPSPSPVAGNEIMQSRWATAPDEPEPLVVRTTKPARRSRRGTPDSKKAVTSPRGISHNAQRHQPKMDSVAPSSKLVDLTRSTTNAENLTGPASRAKKQSAKKIHSSDGTNSKASTGAAESASNSQRTTTQFSQITTGTSNGVNVGLTSTALRAESKSPVEDWSGKNEIYKSRWA